jgi:rhodanese-related sulfurtransferase
MFNILNKTPSASPQEIAQKIQNDSVGFIDVRSKMEYDSGHAQGAKNIPLEMVVDHTTGLKKFSEVYVICASGGRSAQAVNNLRSQGVNAINVSGGTMAWQFAGLPIE